MKELTEFESLLTKAEDDLDVAQRAIRGKKKIFWVACFHAQQSAEKYLKAYLSLQNIAYPKIHDLVEIVQRCEKINAEFTFINGLCQHLNLYAVRIRYSDELDLELRDAKKAISAATEIKEFILKKINGKHRRT